MTSQEFAPPCSVMGLSNPGGICGVVENRDMQTMRQRSAALIAHQTLPQNDNTLKNVLSNYLFNYIALQYIFFFLARINSRL